MNEKPKNSICSICGIPYHVCNSCSEIKSFHPWRKIVDSMNCYKIYLILSEYHRHAVTRETARVSLETCDLSGLDSFIPEIRNLIHEILQEPISAF